MSDRLESWERELGSELSRVFSVDEWEVRCYVEHQSTLTAARQLHPMLKHNQGAVVLARKQVAGRGRRGNSWHPAHGALFYSSILPLTCSLPALPPFTLVIGVVLAQWLRSLGAAVGLKWPNDILDQQGRKLGGVLVELIGEGQSSAILTGVGVNLLEAPPRVAVPVCGLRELIGQDINPVTAAVALTIGIESAWKKFQVEGFKPFRADWLEQAFFLGQVATVEITPGKLVRGRLRGVTDNGLLQLDVGNQIVDIISGHVCLN